MSWRAESSRPSPTWLARFVAISIATTKPRGRSAGPIATRRVELVVLQRVRSTSDRVVRTLVQALSESPAVMAWLPTNGLIRNFTVVVSNIAEGATPAKQLKPLRPSSRFRIAERDGNAYVDPRSYERYVMIADAIGSIDPAGAARLYATLKPRIEEAHRDLGSLNQSFDRTLERAILALLDTPIVDGPVRLKPKGIGYAYADERLESLSAAQKQLLRMGPRNMRIIKARLREIALALGMRPTQLSVSSPS